MGSKLGKLAPYFPRFFKNYNFESRAFKAIEKEKRPVAPRHASTAELLEKFAKDHPELYDVQKIKNEELHNKLRHVRVDSQGINPELKAKRHLPEMKTEVEDPEMGFSEPVEVPKGKLSLRNTLDIIVGHKDIKDKKTPEQLAVQYSLKPEQVNNILKYFQMFEMHVSQESFRTNPELIKYMQKQKKEEKTSSGLVYKISPTTDIPVSAKAIPSGKLFKLEDFVLSEPKSKKKKNNNETSEEEKQPNIPVEKKVTE